MSDHLDAELDDGQVDIRPLREAAEKGKQALKEAEALKRENLFLRAGVDIDSKLGGMLFKTYEGDDIDELRQEWAELSTVSQPKTEAADPPPPSPQPDVSRQATEAQQHRETLTGSGTATSGSAEQTPHPVDVAYQQFHDPTRVSTVDLRSRQEDAMGAVMGAFMQGDPRMRFDPNDWRRKQELYGDD